MQEPKVVGQHRLYAQDVEFGVQFADDLGDAQAEAGGLEVADQRGVPCGGYAWFAVTAVVAVRGIGSEDGWSGDQAR